VSNAAHLLDPEIRVAAEAIASARDARRGKRPASDRLDSLPEPIFANLVDDARAVVDALAAARAQTLPAPRQRGPLNSADAAALGLDLGAGSLLILARDRNGTARGVLWAVSAEAADLGPQVAQHIWASTAAAFSRLPLTDSPTEEQRP